LIGTWCNPDGPNKTQGNITNIYRIYACIRKGEVQDGNRRVIQEKHYEPGIGSADGLDAVNRLRSGIFGKTAHNRSKIYMKKAARSYEMQRMRSGSLDSVVELT
jgi:uncharacterized protein (DUF2235 family)